MLSRSVPDVELKPTKNTVGGYHWYWIGSPLFPLIIRHRIRLDWRRTRSQFKFNDHDLTVKVLNEEMLHYVLNKNVSEKACIAWDNLPRETRRFLQN